MHALGDQSGRDFDFARLGLGLFRLGLVGLGLLAAGRWLDRIGIAAQRGDRLVGQLQALARLAPGRLVVAEFVEERVGHLVVAEFGGGLAARLFLQPRGGGQQFVGVVTGIAGSVHG